MSFRQIRPSSGDTGASVTGSNTSQSTTTPETSGSSDPRRARGDKDTPENTSSKRRRVPESVTRNACLNCKKARAKCDGKKPCKRCATRVETSECIYEIHIKHAKEELVQQIKDLRAKDHMTEQILQALAANEKVPEILERLQNDETYESIVEWLGRTAVGEFETLSPRDSHHSALEASDYEMNGPGPAISAKSPAAVWTAVTTDTTVLNHLFQLYFAWVHPVHTLFSEPRFVESYRRRLDNFCSPVLVNAICAMACHLHTEAGKDELDYVQLGAEFSDAVRSSLDPSDDRLTTMQALAVMYLVDCARGNALRATSYLKTATEALPTVTYQDDEGFAASFTDTVCGVRNLNIEWAQMTFQVAPIIDLVPECSVERDDSDNQDVANWYHYRFASETPVERWPSLLATTNREKSKLNVILQDIATMLYTRPDARISALEFLHQFRRLREWRDELPDEISNIEGHKRQVLPHVLSLLILHTTAVVQLLRPLLDFDGFPAPLVEGTIWAYAQQGLTLLDRQYKVRYSFRYQPVLQMLAALQLIDVVARFFPGGAEGGSKDGPEAIYFGMELLMQSRVSFPVAGPLQEMLRRSAIECSILLPRDMRDLMLPPKPPQQIYQIDDFLGACTRATYVHPIAKVHSKYGPSFSADWAAECPAYGFSESTTCARRLRFPSAEERGAQSLMQIRNLLNSN
ncbi:hypothetical protein PZA11_007552 [Diplocarpon coronariae]|uniref:Transcription factor Cys n=1 Tax=Diplocarpon coronariae TaxID=2795749 RepID=A0A218YY90_9HELO|nr:hypothetical protein JHW43_004084 [Diplocarpon mali]OWP00628.1 transcription factor Cys [Marssonina coronariae]